jgi:hypothetical protein
MKPALTGSALVWISLHREEFNLGHYPKALFLCKKITQS